MTARSLPPSALHPEVEMLPAPIYTIPDSRYAVVLNANAGRMTPRLVDAIRKVVPPQRVYLTESPDHAQEVLRRCVEDEVRTVFAGGGDGTIVGVINTLQRCRTEAAPAVPAVGVLRLGTGNALAHWLGSGRPVQDLMRWQGGLVHRLVPVYMVEAEDTMFPFAGMGQDAAILNDYNQLKKAAKDRWWGPLVKGISGYLLAGYLKTLPNYLRRPKTRVQIINLGRPAYRIGPDGKEIGDPIPAGGVIYEGTSTIVGCATTPLYGYGMRMFPHATRRAGRFQLRVLDTSAFESAINLPAAWRGTMQHPRLHDFYADRVRVRFADAMPYQLAGEAQGYRREMTFSLAEYPVNLVGKA